MQVGTLVPICKLDILKAHSLLQSAISPPMSSTINSPPASWPDASRLALPLGEMTLVRTSLLLLLGAGAAAFSTLFELKLRLPGNSILRPILPYVLGLALVPRAGSGTTMTAGSILGLFGLAAFGHQKGPGGMASLIFLGPMLDLALLNARSNGMLYLRLALAGLAANSLAFCVQLGIKTFGGTAGGGRDGVGWFSIAMLTYPLFGLIAGLLSGLLFFHWRPLRRGEKS